jgi:protocatechuate 3,4-dioxygenase beta subunit
MKLLAVVFLVHLLASSVLAQGSKTTPTPKQDQCRVAGMVVKLAGSEPLRKTKVTLQSEDDRTRIVAVVTDAGGRFELKGIDPGRYRLRASRLGYVSSEYGQRKPEDPGAVLTLRPGQEMKDLQFRLIPSAVIAGRILDEDGEPLPRVNVSALQEVYATGKRSLSTRATAETNDLGEYRLFALAPGRYFVSAVFPHWNRFGNTDTTENRTADPQGYAKMYYPGTPDPAKASSFSIKSGEEIPSVEILMRQVLVYRIRGHVYNQITQKPGAGTDIILTAKNQDREWDAGLQQVNVQNQDGSFEIPEVMPGSYALGAYWYDEGKFYSTTTSVDVGNADVEGIAVTIAPGVVVHGQILWEGKPSLEKDELTVMPMAVDLDIMFHGRARVDAGNFFTLKDMSEGTYHPRVEGQSKDCYIKDVRYAGSSVLEDGFTVTRGAAGLLEITISAHGATVQGNVADADGLPAAGVWAVLVPSAPRRSQNRLYKTQTTDQYGHFILKGIAPGDYQLFSWDEVEQGAWEDADFLKRFEERGEKVTVEEGDLKAVNLTTIRNASVDQQKP